MQKSASSLIVTTCLLTAMLMPCGCSASPTINHETPTVREIYRTEEQPSATSNHKVMADEVQIQLQDTQETTNYPHAICYSNDDINQKVARQFICVLYLNDGDLMYRYQTYGLKAQTRENVLMSGNIVNMELIDGRLIVMDSDNEVYCLRDCDKGIFQADEGASHFSPVDPSISLNEIAVDLQDAEYQFRWLDTEKYKITEAAIRV